MIDVKEHLYRDDPKSGHPDVRTYLENVAYFFLGNGHVQAAVQWAPSGEGTPLGLIVQDPETLGPKRDAPTLDPECGLEPTRIEIESGGDRRTVYRAADPQVFRLEDSDIPTVAAEWRAGPFRVREMFSCPAADEPLVVREIVVERMGKRPDSVRLRTGGWAGSKEIIDETLVFPQEGQVRWTLGYRLNAERRSVTVEVLDGPPPRVKTAAEWQKASQLKFDCLIADRLFQAAAAQLPAVVSRTGRVDASIWQYNREWVRDHSFMAHGLILAGHHDKAGVLLRRLLAEFVSDEGDCIDSSERRAVEDVELDQNGALLNAVREYVCWTGDFGIVEDCWEKIRKTADFPLRPVFRHPASGLLCNSREYWERHAAHGIEPGIELMYQVYPAVGLVDAAHLARRLGKTAEAERWWKESEILKRAVLGHREFRMADELGFIKRRRADGTVQKTADPRPDSGLPDGVPLAGPGPHALQPDVSTIMPILLGFVPPDSPVARETLDGLEVLWNQGWDMGGHGRYNMTSEADSAGPWPLASLLVARASIEAGRPAEARRVLDWLAGLPSAASGAWFEMHGDRISPPYAQIGIIPWAWAEMVMLCVRHTAGIRAAEDAIVLRPRLIPGLNRISGNVPFRGRRFYFEIRAAEPGQQPFCRGDARIEVRGDGTWTIPFENRDIHIEAEVPG
ncbi:MAG: hypothetical protein SCM96_11985 [Acidobacteriota bacterium]|nr:hypothetical protein [Acidobacteriota bacterium]